MMDSLRITVPATTVTQLFNYPASTRLTALMIKTSDSRIQVSPGTQPHVDGLTLYAGESMSMTNTELVAWTGAKVMYAYSTLETTVEVLVVLQE